MVMEFANLFSLLDDFNPQLRECFYRRLKPHMEYIWIDKLTTLTTVGANLDYFYYLKHGMAYGFDNRSNMIWFCLENEILVFDDSLIDGSPSRYQIEVPKGSVLYRIHKHDLYKVDQMWRIKQMLINQLKANYEYFIRLSAELRQCSVEEQVRLMYKRHKQFLMDSPLKTIRSFLGVSIAQISTYRNKIGREYGLA